MKQVRIKFYLFALLLSLLLPIGQGGAASSREVLPDAFALRSAALPVRMPSQRDGVLADPGRLLEEFRDFTRELSRHTGALQQHRSGPLRQPGRWWRPELPHERHSCSDIRRVPRPLELRFQPGHYELTARISALPVRAGPCV